MKERVPSVPQIVLMAGTRVALGAGAGLLLAGKMDRGEWRGAGWPLLALAF